MQARRKTVELTPGKLGSGSGKSVGALRVETLPKRPHGLRLRAGRATCAYAGRTKPAELCPRNYALTLRALLEPLVALELSRFKMSS